MAMRSTRYSPEVRSRAVGMVFEHRSGRASEWSAVQPVPEMRQRGAGAFMGFARREGGSAVGKVIGHPPSRFP